VTKQDIAIVYIRCSPKGLDLSNGSGKVEFPMLERRHNIIEEVNKSNNALDLTLEGKVSTLQKRCYVDLVRCCKDLAAELNITQWTTIMSVQVWNYLYFVLKLKHFGAAIDNLFHLNFRLSVLYQLKCQKRLQKC